MAASGRTMNVRNCSFTPTGGGQGVIYDGITSVSVSGGGSLQIFSGDGDRFPTTVVNDFSQPVVTVTGGNKVKALTYGIGSRGTLVWTEKDARNQGASLASGDITYTMATAVIGNNDLSQSHRQFGTFSLPFTGESIDGVTPPLTASITT